MNSDKNCEILIIGAGITGLSIARELIQNGNTDIMIIDKEPVPGFHASSRNSGVLHAGIYYASNSLKAKFTYNGNLKIQKYCQENNLTLKKTGKVIVASSEDELQVLDTLFERAKQAGAKIRYLDEKELSDIEPNAKTLGKALYSEKTAVVDPKQIIQCIYTQLVKKGVTIQLNTRFNSFLRPGVVNTSSGQISYKYLINAAGTFAEKIAHLDKIGTEYTLVPFKGTYYRYGGPNASTFVNGCIYPVPNMNNPFLGVHFTRSADDNIYIGPTAIPALGRENYHGVKGLSAELLKFLAIDAKLFFTNKNFRSTAIREIAKYSKYYFYRDAKKLVKNLHYRDLVKSAKTGIRPQLINKRTQQLVNDFLILNNENHLHILNAVSPAFTSSFEFAAYLCQKITL